MTDFSKSQALSRIRPSATTAITQMGRDLRAAGRNIISLSIGEPDFETPAHVVEAARDALARGETHYPPIAGIPELKAAIAEKFRRENGLDYGPQEVIVCAGGKQVISNALHATLDPGDEVIIPSPYWVSYPQMTHLFGATPVYLETGPADGFKLRPEALAAAITPRSKWLILNSPGNPSGAAYGRDDLQALTAVLLDQPQVWLLSDDIYEHLLYDQREFVTPVQVEPRLRDRTLTMNGVSKAYSMTGWRIGYAGGPQPLIRGMELIQSQVTGGASRISQWAAVAALSGPQDFLGDRLASFQRRRGLVVEALNAIEGIECRLPEGAFYVFPSCASFLGRHSPGGRQLETDEDFCSALLDEQGVATVQGSAFGLAGHFRVSYATSEESLRAACTRIATFCQGCLGG